MSEPKVLMTDGAQKRQGDSLVPQGAVCRVSRSSTLGLGNAYSVVSFNNKDFDPYNWFDTVTSRFTPKIPGYYRCAFNAYIQNSAGINGAEFDAYLAKNGTRGPAVLGPGSGSWWSNIVTAIIYFNGTTDYVECHVWINTSGNVIAPSAFDAELIGTSVGVTPEPWHIIGAPGEPTFQNGWFNNDSVRTARFYKDPFGTVRLGGFIKGGTISTTAFTLPVGYRIFSNSANFASTANSAWGNVAVQSDGQVIPNGGAVTTWVDLSTISYRADG